MPVAEKLRHYIVGARQSRMASAVPPICLDLIPAVLTSSRPDWGKHALNDMRGNACGREISSCFLGPGNELKCDSVLNNLRCPLVLAARWLGNSVHRTTLRSHCREVQILHPILL